jgi:hypothetical protein
MDAAKRADHNSFVLAPTQLDPSPTALGQASEQAHRHAGITKPATTCHASAY